MRIPVLARTACALTAAVLFIPARAVAAPDAGSEAGLAHLRHFFSHVQAVQADFRQEVRGNGDKLLEESTGRVTMKRPGQFRWDYLKPYERVVVTDGKRVSLYEADLQQVTVRPLAAGIGETPAALLTGGEDILQRFEYVSSWAGEDVAWVRLRPKSAESDFVSIAIGFTGDKPVELELNDRLGQRTHLFFTNVSLNPRVSDKDFQFQVPPGVDVIREGEL